MAFHYYCRHCRQKIGDLDVDIDRRQLGLEQLTEQDEQEMIEYDKQGNVYIRIICEECEQALAKFPDYHEQDTFIQ
ncbi:anti-sigma-F factor Fin family protein [Salipaludibacillus sp. CUR1]|jgi:hypothetical protein|uniref:anti-sigma-F factor Fin family protein n=1 Tax=Salipaludibacillus sp. CUR1 TaxID=2820003 RepID=UPI001E3462AA|nr:anti-sigma-F factor Fin family protein [Salipaludibacillus sp. CUR1]MCE7791256.1 anti-sigma-F factor Fin family protein [Salipaludibacillus sp. CUR1]